MSKKFQIIRPESLTNSDYEEFEYLIRWIGRDGADYQLMFTDVEIRQQTRGEAINTESSTNIENALTRESRAVTLFADDLSRNDLDIVLMIFANRFVTRLKTDGTIERFAPDENSFRKRLSDGRYEISFKLIASDLPVWN